jgi:hypothetical protein
MVEEHIAGKANYTEEIDHLVTVVLIQQTLLGGVETSSSAARQEHLVSPGIA